jgi:hypothetical protein
MTRSAEESIEILEEFDSLLGRQFQGEYEPDGREGLRKRINSSAQLTLRTGSDPRNYLNKKENIAR